MKKYHFFTVMPILLAALFLSFLSCKDEPSGHTPNNRSYGRIAVMPDTEPATSSRTIMPQTDFDSYRFMFTKVSDTISVPDTKELTPDSNGYFTLEVGNYTAELQAFIGNTLIANGVSDTFAVHSGDNEPVLIYLSPISGIEQGEFSYTITYPADAQAVITLEHWSDKRDIPLTPTALSEGNGVTGTMNLDPASYLLTVLVSKNNLYAGTTEAVHIYQLLTTTYTKNFTDDDFTSELPNDDPPPTDPEPEPTSPINFIHYWVDQHDNLLTTNSTTTIAAGETLVITAQSEGYTSQQWYLNGISSEQNGDTFSFTSTTAGNHTVGLFVEKDGKLYNTNILITVKTTTATTTRTIKIDMFDSGNNGWGGNSAIRINVNGNDIATVKVFADNTDNIPNNQKNNNTYNFPVQTGDIVKLFWIIGALQNENSFIVYYTDTPPIPAFNAGSNTIWNGVNALVYKLRGSMNTTKGGSLLGSFTVQ